MEEIIYGGHEYDSYAHCGGPLFARGKGVPYDRANIAHQMPFPYGGKHLMLEGFLGGNCFYNRPIRTGFPFNLTPSAAGKPYLITPLTPIFCKEISTQMGLYGRDFFVLCAYRSTIIGPSVAEILG